MNKPTAGPWGYLSGGIVSNAGLVATVTDRPESDANARLIAAAPGLLEALQGLLIAAQRMPQPVTHDGLEFIDAIAQARTAIREATTKAVQS